MSIYWRLILALTSPMYQHPDPSGFLPLARCQEQLTMELKEVEAAQIRLTEARLREVIPWDPENCRPSVYHGYFMVYHYFPNNCPKHSIPFFDIQKRNQAILYAILVPILFIL